MRVRARERRAASQPRADRAPQRAPRGSSRRAGPVRLPAGGAVRERLSEAREARPGHLLRRFHRNRPLDGAADRAERLPPSALAAARQGTDARRLERADDRGSLPACGGHYVRRVRDHRLPLPPRMGGDVHRYCRRGVSRVVVRSPAGSGAQGPSEISTRSMIASSRGLSRSSLGSAEILSATSIPVVTRPKTVCLPSSHGHASAVTMKNWLPFVFGPAFAIASAPRTIGNVRALGSSSNVYPGPPVPSPRG